MTRDEQTRAMLGDLHIEYSHKLNVLMHEMQMRVDKINWGEDNPKRCRMIASLTAGLNIESINKASVLSTEPERYIQSVVRSLISPEQKASRARLQTSFEDFRREALAKREAAT